MSLLKQTAGSTAVQLMSSAFVGQSQQQQHTALLSQMQMQQHRPDKDLKVIQQQQGSTL